MDSRVSFTINWRNMGISRNARTYLKIRAPCSKGSAHLRPPGDGAVPERLHGASQRVCPVRARVSIPGGPLRPGVPCPDAGRSGGSNLVAGSAKSLKS